MSIQLKKIAVIYLSFIALFYTAGAGAANAVIDVLVVYTKGVSDSYGGDPTTRINQIFQVTNQIYKDSNVNLEVRVAKTMMVNYTDDNDAVIALNDITFARNSAFAGVAAARELAKADMVILYRPYKYVQGSCGIAWIGGQSSNGDFSKAYYKNYMFAHVAINSCGDYVTAHELGHNMGLKHSRKQDGSGATFPYALGYGVLNQFTTIMAYQSEFNVDYWSGKLYKFSNPDLQCKGMPCGISRTDAVNGADARYALNITGPQIANYYSAPEASSSSLASTTSSSRAASLSSKSSSSSSYSSSVRSSSVSSKSRSSVNSSVKSLSSISSRASSSSKSSINFIRYVNAAQYSGADWRNEVGRAAGLTLDQAKAIAAANPKISYFFIIKGAQLSLGTKGVFRMGDTVFFSGQPWLGSAAKLADVYQKNL